MKIVSFKHNGAQYENFDFDNPEVVSRLEAKGIDTNSILSAFLLNQQKEDFSNAIQTLLDNKAKEFRYDNIMSARSYAGYDNPFQAETQKLAVWASNCWVKAGEIEADVQAGNRDMSTVDEVLSELPAYEGV